MKRKNKTLEVKMQNFKGSTIKREKRTTQQKKVRTEILRKLKIQN